MLNGKTTKVLLAVGLIKEDAVEMSEYFPEPKSSGERVTLELDLSDYATKADLKNVTGVDTAKFLKIN